MTQQQFKVGETYATRSMVDYDSITSFTILARTAKTVTVQVRGNDRRRGLFVWDGVEQFRPYGNYSMCHIISADERSIELAKMDRLAHAREG